LHSEWSSLANSWSWAFGIVMQCSWGVHTRQWKKRAARRADEQRGGECRAGGGWRASSGVRRATCGGLLTNAPAPCWTPLITVAGVAPRSDVLGRRILDGNVDAQRADITYISIYRKRGNV